MGGVIIDCTPEGASIYIDDAIVEMDGNFLYVPPGAHSFTAVWTDGANATEKVFVCPLLREAEYHVEQTGGGSSVNYNLVWDKWDTRPAKVKLVKPES
jgi:hypothetical protein